MSKKQIIKSYSKVSVNSFNDCYDDAHKGISVKCSLNFDMSNSNCIKTVAIKKSFKVKITTRFISARLFMFPKY